MLVVMYFLNCMEKWSSVKIETVLKPAIHGFNLQQATNITTSKLNALRSKDKSWWKTAQLVTNNLSRTKTGFEKSNPHPEPVIGVFIALCRPLKFVILFPRSFPIIFGFLYSLLHHINKWYLCLSFYLTHYSRWMACAQRYHDVRHLSSSVRMRCRYCVRLR